MDNSKQKQKKLVVAGWTDFNDDYFPLTQDNSDEAFSAIVEEVRKFKYLFGGDSHENHSACCPVLSDGCRHWFSWRGWGAVIAKAYEQRGKDGTLDHMSGYMDMMIKPEALRYPDGGVDCSLITAPRIYHEISVPPAHDPWGYNIAFVCPSTPQIKNIERWEYIKFIHNVDGEPFIAENRVRRIITTQSVDDILEAVSSEYYSLDAEYFGFDAFGKNITEEQLIQMFIDDFSREEFDKYGATCFIYKELDAGEKSDPSLWIKKEPK